MASNFRSWLQRTPPQIYKWNHTALISSTASTAKLDRSQGKRFIHHSRAGVILLSVTLAKISPSQKNILLWIGYGVFIFRGEFFSVWILKELKDFIRRAHLRFLFSKAPVYSMFDVLKFMPTLCLNRRMFDLNEDQFHERLMYVAPEHPAPT